MSSDSEHQYGCVCSRCFADYKHNAKLKAKRTKTAKTKRLTIKQLEQRIKKLEELLRDAQRDVLQDYLYRSIDAALGKE